MTSGKSSTKIYGFLPNTRVVIKKYSERYYRFDLNIADDFFYWPLP